MCVAAKASSAARADLEVHRKSDVNASIIAPGREFDRALLDPVGAVDLALLVATSASNISPAAAVNRVARR